MARAQELSAEYPQLRSVAVSLGPAVWDLDDPTAQMTTPDRPFVKGDAAETADVLVASPNIFATLGVPAVDGRGFDGRDEPAAPRSRSSASSRPASSLEHAMPSASN